MIKTFERTPYGKEHKIVVLANSKPKIKDTIVLDSKEEFEHYKSTCTGKRAKWATPQGWQLEFNSLWSDLRRAYFIYTEDQNIIDLISKKLKVIEVC